MGEVKGAAEWGYRWWSLLESSVRSYLRGGESNLVRQGNLIRFQSKHGSRGSRGLSWNVAANCICLRFPQTHRTTPMKARSRWNRNHNSLTTESTSSFTSILIPSLFISGVAHSDCFCQNSRYIACEGSLLECSLFSHMDHEKENVYMLFSWDFCGGFQSMEIYISTNWAAEFMFFQVLQLIFRFPYIVLPQGKQMPYVEAVNFQ